MSGKELDDVRDRIENEGFNYAFIHYSDFEEVTDKKFHKLRKAYCDAYQNLAEYLRVD